MKVGQIPPPRSVSKADVLLRERYILAELGRKSTGTKDKVQGQGLQLTLLCCLLQADSLVCDTFKTNKTKNHQILLNTYYFHAPNWVFGVFFNKNVPSGTIRLNFLISEVIKTQVICGERAGQKGSTCNFKFMIIGCSSLIDLMPSVGPGQNLGDFENEEYISSLQFGEWTFPKW